MKNLFEPSNFSQKEKQIPLALKITPQTLDTFFGQQHLLASGKLLRRAIESDRLGSVLFFGPPGTGKSSLARLIAQKTKSHFSQINAVTAGVSDLRKEIQAAKIRLEQNQIQTILLVDEIHHFNRTQQDALLPDVEKGTLTLIGITSENPFFYVNSALRSRSQIFEFFTLSENELDQILTHALNDKENGFGNKNIQIDADARQHLVRFSQGDARRLLNALEIGVKTTPFEGTRKIILFTLKVAEESLQKRALLYDKKGDSHYDTISAFIKSMRGSDPNATLYWMAKMIEAGETPEFIARRIAICASEDVGNADPQALILANAAFQILERIGMPEGRIPLAQAALYVACAPKSNAAYVAINAALEDVRTGKVRDVPNALKDASVDGKQLGHGKGYLYPHNFPNHWVKQEYFPDPKPFYKPSTQGEEKKIVGTPYAMRKQNDSKK